MKHKLFCRPDKELVTLRDLGSLHTLISRKALEVDDYVDSGEQRFIRGVTSDPIAGSLVEICVKSVLCNGRLLVGLSDCLPQKC